MIEKKQKQEAWKSWKQLIMQNLTNPKTSS